MTITQYLSPSRKPSGIAIIVGQLLGIAIRHKKRGAMHQLDHASVTTITGVADDFRGKPGERQVTVLAREGWQAACQEIDQTLPWLTRRANLYIEGAELQGSTGKHLHIGQLQLLITRETDPCSRMQEAHADLFGALAKAWRGGVCCRVVQDGVITAGDQVRLVDAP